MHALSSILYFVRFILEGIFTVVNKKVKHMVHSYNSIILKGEFKASIGYIVNLRLARGIETLRLQIKSIVFQLLSRIMYYTYY